MFLVDWPGGSWQATLQLGGLVVGLYLAALWVALIFWTYRDIRQRTRDPVMQLVAVLVVVLLFLPGLWVYLILRPRYTLVELYERSLEEEALLQELEDQKACPTCRRKVTEEYLICPSCRTQLKEPCRHCGKPLSYAWLACPYCATEKPHQERAQQRPARRPQQAARRAQPATATAGGPPPANTRTVPAPAPTPPPARAQEPTGRPQTQQEAQRRQGNADVFGRHSEQGSDPVVDATAE